MFIFSGPAQNPGSSVLSCNCLMVFFRKASEKSITIIHPAGDESMNKFL